MRSTSLRYLALLCHNLCISVTVAPTVCTGSTSTCADVVTSLSDSQVVFLQQKGRLQGRTSAPMSTRSPYGMVSTSTEDYVSLLQAQVVASSKTDWTERDSERTQSTTECVIEREQQRRNRILSSGSSRVKDMIVSSTQIQIKTQKHIRWLRWKDYSGSEAADMDEKGLTFVLWGVNWGRKKSGSKATVSEDTYYTKERLTLTGEHEKCQGRIDKLQSDIDKYYGQYLSENRGIVPTKKDECVITSNGWIDLHRREEFHKRTCDGLVTELDVGKSRIRMKTRTEACIFPVRKKGKTPRIRYAFEIVGAYNRSLTISGTQLPGRLGGRRWKDEYWHTTSTSQHLTLRCDCAACHELLDALISKINTEYNFVR
eukprot:gnl/TRDRNA2_/TRDRNA2_126116_c0_seq1.p1 gnl/TRDRNA2_/TRDRNA2_126116_c0~~gnl/TRDRNA2_/TRDRNA2_126116_c0_seq1.p1  ORF type:complete len:371 (+),score=28.15 gnl/TRDRNA2_/TRDRNA2_126116_c0_seq1:80-1192(+)